MSCPCDDGRRWECICEGGALDRCDVCERWVPADELVFDEAGRRCEDCDDRQKAAAARAAGLPESFCRRLEGRTR